MGKPVKSPSSSKSGEEAAAGPKAAAAASEVEEEAWKWRIGLFLAQLSSRRGPFIPGNGFVCFVKGGLFLRPKINIDQLSCNLIHK